MIELNLSSLTGNPYPNASFHDSKIHTICLDYVSHEATLDCELDIYGPDDSYNGPDYTRRGILKLTGLLYFVIEPPDARYPYDAEGIGITDDDPVEGTIFSTPPNLPKLDAQDADAAFVHWLFVDTWNAFIFFAAKGASFEWKQHQADRIE